MRFIYTDKAKDYIRKNNIDKIFIREDVERGMGCCDLGSINLRISPKGKNEDMLKKETWFDCEKALENGFIDEIKETVPKQKEEEEKTNQSNIDIQNLVDLITDELEKRNAGVEQKPVEEEKTNKISNFSKFMKGM